MTRQLQQSMAELRSAAQTLRERIDWPVFVFYLQSMMSVRMAFQGRLQPQMDVMQMCMVHAAGQRALQEMNSTFPSYFSQVADFIDELSQIELSSTPLPDESTAVYYQLVRKVNGAKVSLDQLLRHIALAQLR